jgi:hypothetical protein
MRGEKKKKDVCGNFMQRRNLEVKYLEEKIIGYKAA